jgi:aminopeptidase N
MRAMNDSFFHRTVESADIEQFWSRRAGRNLARIFDQYLRTAQIPTLEFRVKGRKLMYRWINCIVGYDIPVKVILNEKQETWLAATTEWKSATYEKVIDKVVIHPNCYANIRPAN